MSKTNFQRRFNSSALFFFAWAILSSWPGSLLPAQSDVPGAFVQIRAKGDEGTEKFLLLIDEQSVAQFEVGTTYNVFVYELAESIEIDQIRIEFVNDQYDPSNGLDSNLTVDYVAINGVRFQTEDPTTFSTGTWLAEDGIQPGQKC